MREVIKKTRAASQGGPQFLRLLIGLTNFFSAGWVSEILSNNPPTFPRTIQFKLLQDVFNFYYLFLSVMAFR